MFNKMICNQHRQEEERCWVNQERHFVVPSSELQILPVAGESRIHTRLYS